VWDFVINPTFISGPVLVSFGLSLVLGCSPGQREPDADGAALQFVYISPDPLGVNPFLVMGQTGTETIAEKYGARVVVMESEDPTTREENVRFAIDEGADIVVVLGFEFADILARLAPGAPTVEFLIIDQCIENRPANVHCGMFREFESSFALGAMAAMLSETRNVGVVGAADIPFLHRYTDGFEAGAKYVDPDIGVSVRWVGGPNAFSDPVRAKEQALALASSGVDYIFAAAAAGNLGVFEAAEESNFFTFGLDIDQCSSVPGRVVDNLIKRVDVVIAHGIDSIMNGAESGFMVYGLGNGGLELAALEPGGAEGSECMIYRHPDVMRSMQDLKDLIVSGEAGIEDPMGII
jgi:basic membrane protein A